MPAEAHGQCPIPSSGSVVQRYYKNSMVYLKEAFLSIPEIIARNWIKKTQMI